MCNRISQQEAFFVGCGMEEINISRSPTWAQNRIPFAAISGYIHKSIDRRRGRGVYYQPASVITECKSDAVFGQRALRLLPLRLLLLHWIRRVYHFGILFGRVCTLYLICSQLPSLACPVCTYLSAIYHPLVAGEGYFTNSRSVVICATNSATLCLQIEIIWSWYPFTRER